MERSCKYPTGVCAILSGSVNGCRGGSWIYINLLFNTLIYFKLSYVCPKTWRFRKCEGWLASQGFWNPPIPIFFLDSRISVCVSEYYIRLVDCSKGGWLATQSTPSGSSPGLFIPGQSIFHVNNISYPVQFRHCSA